jgi:hypothetical protein
MPVLRGVPVRAGAVSDAHDAAGQAAKLQPTTDWLTD